MRSDAAQLEGDAFVQEHGDLVAVGVSCDIAHKKHVTLLIDNGFSSSMVVQQLEPIAASVGPTTPERCVEDHPLIEAGSW